MSGRVVSLGTTLALLLVSASVLYDQADRLLPRDSRYLLPL